MMSLATLHPQEAEAEACCVLTGSFCSYSVGDPSLGDGRAHIQGSFLHGLNLSGDILIDTPRVFFYGDSTSSLVTLKITQHAQAGNLLQTSCFSVLEVGKPRLSTDGSHAWKRLVST